MSLRTKLVLTLTLLTALATISVGTLAVVATSRRLHSEVDRSLSQAAEVVAARPGLAIAGQRPGRRPNFGQNVLPVAELEQIVVQVIDDQGEVVTASSETELPVDANDIAIAEAGGDPAGGDPVGGDPAGGDPVESGPAESRPPPASSYRTVDVDGTSYRVLTVPVGQGRAAVQLGRDLDETDRLVQSLRNIVLLTVVLVTLAAAVIGWIVALQITRRLVRLTSAAEEVADTGRLDIDVPVDGNDETGRLGAAFDKMLAALARSRDSQQRLVQDAGHELRTPLTSLRTNVSVLRRHDDLPAETRDQVLSDIDAETRQLSTLVEEIVGLATDSRKDEPVTAVSLATIVGDVAERARRRSGRIVEVDTDDSVVQGRPQALERAVSNLVDNAIKFDDSGAPVQVSVRAGRVEVSDRGVGIDPAEATLVFDRFHRSVTAQSRPGSGLGLAIVRDIAEAHGGEVFAAAREGGGATVGFTLPTATTATT